MRIVDDPRTLSGLKPIELPPDTPPSLCVSVDTEEEFDWGKPLDRESTATSAIAEIWRFQEVCDAHGVAPVYVIDYPIAQSATAVELLGGFAQAKRCEIGAHLHAWVNPPHVEPVDSVNSYQGNLDPALEQDKLGILVQTIEGNFGVRPKVHKAGRYGFGWHTARALEELGFTVDMSAMPPFDCSADGGPIFDDAPLGPAWVGAEGSLLEIPNSGGFVGLLAGQGQGLYPMIQHPLGNSFKVGGICSRLGLLERTRLSPEGFDLEELRRLTRHLLARGQKVFNLSLHSPSMKPGCTPYVRSDAERDAFLEVLRGYYEFFATELGGVMRSAGDIAEQFAPNGHGPADQ